MADMSRAAPVRPASPGPLGHGALSLSDNLRIAASRGQLEAVKDLLVAGAGLEPDREGRNALHFAAQEGHAEVCKYLAAQGFDADMQDVMGYSPLLRAASQGAQDVVQVLLDAGCDVNVQDEHGNAAIHEACWNGFSKTAELLVKYNCDVCLINKAGFTALHLAAQNGHNESSRVLLYAGVNPDLKNNYGDTALHTAARYGHAGVARILISARCKLNEQNKNGDSALHIAAALKRRKIAKILVESGIDVELVNKQNEIAVDVAKRKEHPEIIVIISTFSKPRPSSFRSRHVEHVGVTFKDDIDVEDGPVVCPEDEPPLKPEPKSEKQEKERRFFFFKKKKKEKDKTPSTPTTARKKGPELFRPNQEKSAVHGFFSQYVPRDGVQLYRDLAGNVKQGPIGYAPVCQCGPSLKRLEHDISDTRESLHDRIDVSHQILSQRMDTLDIRARQQAYATEAKIQDRFNSEHNACHARISERLQEERQETRAMVNQANAELEYWLNDKLASYGHCLDHHHDDSALPPRNLFLDFPSMGRLVRSRSDETLSASDCSGKFRKKDFYSSRQAAMQQIRGWDVSAADKFTTVERGRRRERNNNSSIPNNNKVVIQAQVHTRGSDRLHQPAHWDNRIPDNAYHGSYRVSSNEPDILSPSTNSTTSPGTLASSQNAGTHTYNPGQTPVTHGHSSASRHGPPPRRQNENVTPYRDTTVRSGVSEREGALPRVTFSNDQSWQQSQQQSQHPAHRMSSPPPQGTSYYNRPDSSRQSMKYTARLSSPVQQHSTHPHQQAPATHYHQQSMHQNLPTGGPLPNSDIRSGEKGGSQTPRLTGQERNQITLDPSIGSVQQKLTRYQDGYGVRYMRPRTLSTDSMLDEDNPSSRSQQIPRCRSVENTLDDVDHKSTDAYNSGYVTDSALKSSGGNRYNTNFRSVRENHSASPAARATTRYRLPETSAGASSISLRPPPRVVSPHGSTQQDPRPTSAGQNLVRAQSPAHVNRFLNRTDGNKPATVSRFHDVSRDYNSSRPLNKSMHSLNNTGSVQPSQSYNTFGVNDSVRSGSDKPVVGAKSDPNLLDSQSQPSQYTAPVKECLQHENLVSTNVVPSPVFVSGNKEDSTCSSNQDSGYGSRNHGVGVRRGGDTSGGTPSSSFSMERSSCNTPSNAGSPHPTQGDFTSTDYRTTMNEQSAYTPQRNGDSHQYSAHSSPRDQPSRTQTPQRVTNTEVNYSAYSQSPYLYNNSTSNQDDSHESDVFRYDRPHQTSISQSTSSNYPLSQATRTSLPRSSTQPGINNASLPSNDYGSYRHNSPSSSNNPGQNFSDRTSENYSNTYNTSQSYQQKPYNYQHPYSQTPQANPSQSFRSQSNRPQPQTVADANSSAPSRNSQTFSSTTNNHNMSNNNTATYNKPQNTADSQQQWNDQSDIDQSAVQAHVENWYQRKLMEAAQRLRQSQNYSQPSSERSRSMYSSKDGMDYSVRQEVNKTPDNKYGGYNYNNQQSSTNSSVYPHQNYNLVTDSARQGSIPPYNTPSQRQNVTSYTYQQRTDGSSYSQGVPNTRESVERRTNNYNDQSFSNQHRDSSQVRRTLFDRNSNLSNGVHSGESYGDSYGRNMQNNNVNPQTLHLTTPNGMRYDPLRGSDV